LWTQAAASLIFSWGAHVCALLYTSPTGATGLPLLHKKCSDDFCVHTIVIATCRDSKRWPCSLCQHVRFCAAVSGFGGPGVVATLSVLEGHWVVATHLCCCCSLLLVLQVTHCSAVRERLSRFALALRALHPAGIFLACALSPARCACPSALLTSSHAFPAVASIVSKAFGSFRSFHCRAHFPQQCLTYT
jgi:hypothetical protein